MRDLHARFCAALQPMIEDIARQMDADWRGEHLIRAAPRAAASAPVEDPAEPSAARAEKVRAIRNAALAGLSRMEAAEITGLSYNSVVWICQRHRIAFPDTRRRRRRTGAV